MPHGERETCVRVTRGLALCVEAGATKLDNKPRSDAISADKISGSDLGPNALHTLSERYFVAWGRKKRERRMVFSTGMQRKAARIRAKPDKC